METNKNKEIFQFLRELAVNNNREWFQAHKERFDALRNGYLQQVQELINRIALFDPELAGLEAKDCVFRIYRDIRFSPNKVPYKTYLGAYMAKGGRKSEYAGYYLHLEPGNSLLSGGIYMPPNDLLKRLRQDIYDQIEEFEEILEAPAFKATYPELTGEMLTRMPVGFPADSPYGHILKHKDFSVYASKSDTFFDSADWIDQAITDYKLLQPFNRFLNYTVEEYLGRV